MEGTDLSLWDARPVARAGDPDTSWEAAASVDMDKLRASQRLILELLRAFGPMTDRAIWGCLIRGDYTDLTSPSGARTRRSELVAMGAVFDTGERIPGPTGRLMIVWAAR